MMSLVRKALVAAAATAGLATLSACAPLGLELGNTPKGLAPTDVHARVSAREIAQEPCKHGDLAACVASCKRDHDAKSCNMLGVLFEFDADGRDDPARASGFYRLACDAAYYPGCNNLAWLYVGGRGVPQDKPQAMRLFYYAYEAAKEACRHGDASGCLMAGEFLFEGRGVGQDTEQAVSLLDQACTFGEHRGCELAEQIR